MFGIRNLMIQAKIQFIAYKDCNNQECEILKSEKSVRYEYDITGKNDMIVG